jgi:hypothetical protein
MLLAKSGGHTQTFGGATLLDAAPVTLGASVNDWNPPQLADATQLVINAVNAVNITGIQGADAGRTLTLTAADGSQPVTLKNASGSSAAANRMALGADFTLSAGDSLTLICISPARGWRLFNTSIGAAGTGTVSSVGLVENGTDALFTVTGSPVTTAGNLGFQLTKPVPSALAGSGYISQALVGNGIADDTVALQAAFDHVAATGGGGAVANGPLILLPGTYRITSPITVRSGVVVKGFGRNFSTIIKPDGCGLFIFDGSLYVGGYVFRVDISDITWDLTTAVATDAIKMDHAYNIKFENFNHYNQAATVTNGFNIKTCNDIQLNSFIASAPSPSVPFCILIDGTVASTSVKMIEPDLENFNRGIKTVGYVDLDIVTPYSERCVVALEHQSSGGVTNVYGGEMNTTNGITVHVGGDNLNVHGTDILADGGIKITVDADIPRKNVNFFNCPGILATDVNGTGLGNIGALNFYPALARNVSLKTTTFYKSLVSATPTPICDLQDYANFARFRLKVMAGVGAGLVVNYFDFIITSNTIVGGTDPIVTALSSFTNGNWGMAIGTLTLTPSGTKITVGLTCTTSGALGTGSPAQVWFELESYTYSEAAGTITLL